MLSVGGNRSHFGRSGLEDVDAAPCARRTLRDEITLSEVKACLFSQLSHGRLNRCLTGAQVPSRQSPVQRVLRTGDGAAEEQNPVTAVPHDHDGGF